MNNEDYVGQKRATRNEKRGRKSQHGWKKVCLRKEIISRVDTAEIIRNQLENRNSGINACTVFTMRK